LISRLGEIGLQKKVSVAQLALAWILSKGKEIIPLVGARRRPQLMEALETLAISFSPEEIATIERAVPLSSVAGERYGREQMAVLDSERRMGAAG
jgi:aryl-alcohol dehydrogenase-like predicted oxidoreductase